MSCLSALKRIFRSRSFIILSLLCAFGVFFAALPAPAGKTPPAGVLDLSGGEESRRIVEFLLENGYETVENQADGEEMLREGLIDCLLILPADLSARLSADELEGAVPFISAPGSLNEELYRNLAAAALFREQAPYITALAFEGSGLDREKALESYWAMFNSGFAFAFEVSSAQGAPIPKTLRSQSLLKAVLGCLMMSVLFSGAAETARGSFASLRGRLGLTKALKRILLPELLLRGLMLWLAVSLALLAAAVFGGVSFGLSLILPALAAVFLFSAAGLLLAEFLPGRGALYVILPLLLIGALALCPIYTDLSLLFPAAGYIRLILPPWWLWPMTEAPLLWLIISLAAFALALYGLYLRGRILEKYK